MKASSAQRHLQKARKTFLTAETTAREVDKKAVAARSMNRQARAKLKHARKLAKLAKKLGRRAEDEVAEAHRAMEEAAAQLQKAEKKAHKSSKKSPPKAPAHRKAKPKSVPAKSVRPVPTTKRKPKLARRRVQPVAVPKAPESAGVSLASNDGNLAPPIPELPAEPGQIG